MKLLKLSRFILLLDIIISCATFALLSKIINSVHCVFFGGGNKYNMEPVQYLAEKGILT